MHAVESNNADMVHFLIEVTRVCGLVGRRGEKGCDSALFDTFSFLFPAHTEFAILFQLIHKTFKELEQNIHTLALLSEPGRHVVLLLSSPLSDLNSPWIYLWFHFPC